MDIRRIGDPLTWPKASDFCFCSVRDQHTESGYRIYLAKCSDHKVLGSFPTIRTTAAAIAKFQQLEAEANDAIAS